MGDNRDECGDSRFWGFLDASRVKGKAEVVYFSYERDGMTPFAWLREIRWKRIEFRGARQTASCRPAHRRSRRLLLFLSHGWRRGIPKIVSRRTHPDCRP